MNVDDFFKHHGITENPFGAEEARHDPIFERLIEDNTRHPDFGKILGRIDQPSAAIVFGEKGSGKTAIRLLIGRKVAEHNRAVTQSLAAGSGAGALSCTRTLLVAHDDLNPALDRFVKHRKQFASDRNLAQATEKVLAQFRLADHQDAILSKAVTLLTDAVLEDNSARAGADGEDRIELLQPAKQVKTMPRRLRVNLGILAALYDQPADGNVIARWQRLRSRLRLGWVAPMALARRAGLLFLIAALGLAGARVVMAPENQPPWLVYALGFSVAVGVILLVLWAWQTLALWSLARRIHRDTPTIDRTPGELRRMLSNLRTGDVRHQPWP